MSKCNADTAHEVPAPSPASVVRAIEPRLLTVNDACKYLTLSRAVFYSEARSDRLRLVKLGKATRVERTELDRWLDARIADEAATLNEGWVAPVPGGGGLTALRAAAAAA